MTLELRMRRLRTDAGVRRLFAETSVEPRHLVQPYFVVPGTGVLTEVKKGYGLWQVSADRLEAETVVIDGAGGDGQRSLTL